MSKLIDEALMDNGTENADIVASDVDSKELNLIVQYCEKFKFEKTTSDIEHPLPSKDPKVYIKNDWEREFALALDLDATCELLMAANYFNIPAIFELCCA